MTDGYTKAVLTIIAACLVVIVIRGFPITTTAEAQSGPVHVVLDRVSQFAFEFATVPVHVEQ